MGFKKYEITIVNWMTYVFAMWQNVFNFISYFKNIEKKWLWKTLLQVNFIWINKHIQSKYEQWK